MIIIDADFLSSFLKIERINLIFKAFETKTITITNGVLHELGQAPVREKILEALESQEHKIVVKEVEEDVFGEFGKGEMESINLAKKNNALLLMDDRKAAQFAKQEGVTVISIPAFLIHCKTNNIISKNEIHKIVTELREKDYYEFSDDVKKTLMQ